jgi:hypothetical protein
VYLKQEVRSKAFAFTASRPGTIHLELAGLRFKVNPSEARDLARQLVDAADRVNPRPAEAAQ